MDNLSGLTSLAASVELTAARRLRAVRELYGKLENEEEFENAYPNFTSLIFNNLLARSLRIAFFETNLNITLY
jgi:hypothetical protein